jgi:hypothetical protein
MNLINSKIGSRQSRFVNILKCTAILVAFIPCALSAGTTVFFDSAQIVSQVVTGTTFDTISTEGYLFTYTRDKLFTGGVGLTNPIGRTVRIAWPQGIEAQYVTAGPTPGNAKITVRRVDGAVFDLTAFTAHLLANPGAGRAIEIVPKKNGEEPLKDPLFFDVSNGGAGSEFTFNTSPNYYGSTAALTNYDTYVINLSLDYAVTALTLHTQTPNQPPTDISISSDSVLENDPLWTPVGTFSTTDPDAGDTFTYTLVLGTGSDDNSLFSISGGDLLTEASFNYEVKSNYTIRVQSEDQDGLFTQKVFTVTVSDVVEPPPVIQELVMTTNGEAVISWSSLPNHLYTVHYSTNLLTGFSVLESNVPANPILNTYTDTVFGVSHKLWKISTEP